MPHIDFDLVVIGAGAGGLTAARFAARLGARVALVERDRIGGDCTWTGCVPSKSLIRAAKAAHEARASTELGVEADAVRVDMRRVREYVRRKIAQIYQGTTPEKLRSEGIDVSIGPAAFVDAHALRVGDRELRAQNFLITTGATPAAPKLAGIEDVPHFTYHAIFENDRLPPSLVVVGGGPLGAEISQAYRRLGSEVTIVAPRLLARDDPDASAVVRRVFEREGIRVVSGRATSVRRASSGVVVTSDAGEVTGDALLVAAGRTPNVEGLALDRAGVRYSASGIPVDDRLRTSVPHIYAAGDVLGGEQFSHVAGWQAFEAARNALLPGSASGRPNPMAWVTFTDPEVAQIGPTERQAREQLAGRVSVCRWELTHIDRAVCDDDEDGFIKLVTDAGGRVVGATIVASRAGELSGEIALAIAKRLTAGDIATAIHAYPTYATALQQMAGEVATTNWLASTQGRLVRRLKGFTHAEA